MKEQLIPLLVELLTPVLMLLASWAIVAFARWLRSHKAVADSRWALTVLNRVEAEALSVVREIDQTLVARLKKASADGVFTADEKRELRDVAIARLRARVQPEELRRLLSTGEIEQYLQGKIEAALAEHKLQQIVSGGSTT